MAFGWYHTKRRWRTYCSVLMILSFVMFFTATIFLQHDMKEFEPPSNFDSLQDVQDFINMVNSTYNAVRVQLLIYGNSLRERITLEDGSHIVVADMLLDDSDPEHVKFDDKNNPDGNPTCHNINFAARWRIQSLHVNQAIQCECSSSHSNARSGGWRAFGISAHTTFRAFVELSKRNTDSSRWKVDCSYIQPNTYYHICAETIFYCDALNFSRDIEANVLLLGLGGGVMDCFLHYHFPKINISVVEISAQMVHVAYKWFNFEQDNHHHLVIADGVEFVKQQALKGAQYDAIILDACYSQLSHKILCPTDSFLKKSSIHYLSNVVSDRGIIVINAVPGTITASEECALLLELFSDFFDYCNTRNTTGENEVVYCMHRPPFFQKHIDLLSVMKSSA